MTNQVCSNCGAAIPDSRRTTCEFCGHELPRQENAPSEHDSLSDRIQRDLPLVREAPEFAALQRRVPPAPPSFAAFKVISGIGTVIACVIGLGMLAFAITVTSFLPESMKLFAIVPLLGLAMVGLFIRMSIKARSKVSDYQTGPLERRVVGVLDERTEVRGGGDSMTSTSYFITFLDEEGRREELPVVGKTAGEVTNGDVGVVFVRGGFALDFQRVNV